MPLATFAFAMLFALSLGGCSSMDWNSLSVADFNPLKGSDPLRSNDFNYYYGREGRGSGPVTAVDLIGPDGRCAFDPGPAAPSVMAAPPPPVAAAPPADQPINPRSNQALYFTAGPQAGEQQASIPSNEGVPPEVRNGPRGVALAMTECEVVRLLGYTERVEVGSEGGRRSVVLTYMTGERPGIYRFRDGRLVSMERVEGLPEPKKKQPPKRAKTAKAKKQVR
jgi:hypothetical protein